MTVENKLYVGGVPIPFTGRPIEDGKTIQAAKSLLTSALNWPPELLYDALKVPTDVFVAQPHGIVIHRYDHKRNNILEIFPVCKDDINKQQIVVDSRLGGVVTRRVHWKP